jgi:rhodanese-related sulfurtransferase
MDLDQLQWAAQSEVDPNSIILDVRTPDEWQDGIIPSALLLDIYQGQGFLDGLEKLDKSKNYYVYCRSGGRSAQACQIMNQLGFSNTYNLMGGMNNWTGPVDAPNL